MANPDDPNMNNVTEWDMDLDDDLLDIVGSVVAEINTATTDYLNDSSWSQADKEEDEFHDCVEAFLQDEEHTYEVPLFRCQKSSSPIEKRAEVDGNPSNNVVHTSSNKHLWDEPSTSEPQPFEIPQPSGGSHTTLTQGIKDLPSGHGSNRASRTKERTPPGTKRKRSPEPMRNSPKRPSRSREQTSPDTKRKRSPEPTRRFHTPERTFRISETTPPKRPSKRKRSPEPVRGPSCHRAASMSPTQSPPRSPSRSPTPSPPQPPTQPLQQGVQDGSEGNNHLPNYTLRRRGVRTFMKNGAVDTTFEVRFADRYNNTSLSEMYGELADMFKDVLQDITFPLYRDDLIRLVIHHDTLENPIVVSLRPLERLTINDILAKIEDTLNSNQELKMNNSFRIDIGTIKIPRGGARKYITDVTGVKNSILLKRSMVFINNRDQICLARAISVAWANSCRVSTDEWHAVFQNRNCSMTDAILEHKKVPGWYLAKLRDKSRYEQTRLAHTLCERANVSTEHPASLNDLPAFEAILGVGIAVISSRAGNRFIRVPPQNDNDAKPKIYIYHVGDENGTDEGHYHAITKISGFFSKSYFCDNCLTPFGKREKHTCYTRCSVCCSSDCRVTDSWCVCIKCNMTCRSPECLQRHSTKTKRKAGEMMSQCDLFWKCRNCKQVISKRNRDIKEHECGEWMCQMCNSYVLGQHRCYQRALTKVNTSDFSLLFFDYETQQDILFQCTDGYVIDGERRCGLCANQNMQCAQCTICINCNDLACGSPMHKPCMVIAHTVCNHCVEHSIDELCKRCGTRCERCNKWDPKEGKYSCDPCPNTCGKREVVFKGENSDREFGKWLFSSQHRNITAVAHNMRSFDGWLLLDHLIQNSIYPDKIIYNGAKIMYLHIGRGLNIRVIDSLNFLPMPLSGIPKAFGLTELKKGFFPHYFVTTNSWDYVGPMPDPHHYGVDQFSNAGKLEFDKWYAEHKDDVFNLQKEMVEYCRSDVTILREGCMKFRSLMLDITREGSGNGVDPFNSLTIASVCMAIYRTKFLTEQHTTLLSRDGEVLIVQSYVKDGVWSYDVNGKMMSEAEVTETWQIVNKKFLQSPIAYVPIHTGADNFSKKSIQWLEWEAKRRGISIQHALSVSGEYRIPNTRYKVDGYHQSTNTCFEFHGCIWHGCPDCFKKDRIKLKHPYTGQSFLELFRATMEKKKKLAELGYNYVSIWECKFDKKLQTLTHFREFCNSLDIVERLDPRDSFFGGRTNAARLYHKAQQGEEVKYIDFTSLYPFVNKTCKYPVGHPEIYVGDGIKHPLSHYFGIAKVKVLAPKGLYHPVLPYKSCGKLKFALCKWCADNEYKEVCVCCDEKRAFLGTWSTPELSKAIEKGYHIIKIYEVYHWQKTTQFDVQQGSGGLFAEYINLFLRLKQQASGWPSWCVTEEDKLLYIRNYKEREGVSLDYESIQKNPGLRSLAKLCLNSFWGKFGQRSNFRQNNMFHDSEADKFYKLLTDPQKEVQDFTIMSKDVIAIQWNYKSDVTPQVCSANTNVYIATFTTCWARLKLYDALDLLQRRALYYDTDSILFVSKKDEPEPPLDDYLGGFTNELNPGEHITEYVSGGPKNYAYKTNKGGVTCKVRGFTLNYCNSKIINFETVLNEVMGVPQTVVTTNPKKITRNKKLCKVLSKVENKRYSMVYTKRVVKEEYYTVPYGY